MSQTYINELYDMIKDYEGSPSEEARTQIMLFYQKHTGYKSYCAACRVYRQSMIKGLSLITDQETRNEGYKKIADSIRVANFKNKLLGMFKIIK